jgi:hypothetical protein
MTSNHASMERTEVEDGCNCMVVDNTITAIIILNSGDIVFGRRA